MPYTIPADNKTVGSPNPPVDMNDVADVLTGFDAGYNVWNTAFAGGADPTGAADSTAAINAALAAGHAYLPARNPATGLQAVYKISSPLLMGSGAIMEGTGFGGLIYGNGNSKTAALIKPTAAFSGAAAVLIDGSGGSRDWTCLRNLVIDGSSLSSGTSNGILAQGSASGLMWENITVSKFWAANIVFATSGGNTPNGIFRNVTSWFCQNSDGFLLNIQDSEFIDCMSFGNIGYGWNLTSFPNTTFTSCRAEHNTLRGFYASGGTFGGNILFTACSTDQNNQDGFYLSGLTGIGGVQLTGCSFKRDGNNAGAGSTTYSGIAVVGCTVPVNIGNCAVQAQEGDSSSGIGPHFAVTMATSSFVSIDGGYYAHTESAGLFFNWDAAGALSLNGSIILGKNTGGSYPGTVTNWRGGRYAVLKPSGTSRTSTTTPSADPHLTTELPGNSTFMFEFWLLMDGPASSAAEFQAGLTSPAGASTQGWSIMGLAQSAAGVSASLTAQAATLLSGTRSVGLAGTGTITSAIMKGMITTGTTSGTFALNWAQGVSDATATTLDGGSIMTMTQIS